VHVELLSKMRIHPRRVLMTGTCVVLVIAITLFLQYFYRFYLLDLPSDKLYQERDPNSFHRPTSVGATLRVTAVDDGLVIARNDCRAFYQQFQATGTRVWPVDEDVDDRIVNQIRLEDVGVSQQLKTILVFDGLGEDTDGGQGRFISDRCPVNRCTLTDQLDRVDAADVVIFKVSYVITIKNIIVTSSLAECTSSSAVAKRPRDASCLSVVSFNIPIQRSFLLLVTTASDLLVHKFLLNSVLLSPIVSGGVRPKPPDKHP